ncbi:MAG: cytochrome c oxidase subunit 3 family protein [Myxococcales bacterium]
MAAEAAAAPGHGHGAGHGQAPAGVPAGILGHHFKDLAQQNEAVRLGMWLFLATEVLLFAGLFTAYAYYRFQFPEGFAQASRHVDLWAGTLNTFVLITSSLTAALAIHFARTDRKNLAVLCLVATLLMAFAFLGIKSIEYLHKFHEGALPGRYYHFEEVQIPGAPMYFTIYFLATGLHAIHVIVGMTVLAILAVKTARGRFSSGYYTGLELGGLYWHLVDLIWIFLYPLLYLI